MLFKKTTKTYDFSSSWNIRNVPNTLNFSNSLQYPGQRRLPQHPLLLPRSVAAAAAAAHAAQSTRAAAADVRAAADAARPKHDGTRYDIRIKIIPLLCFWYCLSSYHSYFLIILITFDVVVAWGKTETFYNISIVTTSEVADYTLYTPPGLSPNLSGYGMQVRLDCLF